MLWKRGLHLHPAQKPLQLQGEHCGLPLSSLFCDGQDSSLGGSLVGSAREPEQIRQPERYALQASVSIGEKANIRLPASSFSSTFRLCRYRHAERRVIGIIHPSISFGSAQMMGDEMVAERPRWRDRLSCHVGSAWFFPIYFFFSFWSLPRAVS